MVQPHPHGYRSTPPPPFAGQPPPGPETNGFAIAALVLGIAAPMGGGLLSLIFGFVALNQIKKYGQRGRGLAIGGLNITALWLALIAVVVAVGLSGSGQLATANRV